MQNTPTQTGSTAAELVLNNALRLGGDLSLLPDGHFQLDGLYPLDAAQSRDKISITRGSVATLSLLGIDNEDVLPKPGLVKITNLNDNCLTLEFAPADRKLAEQYRELVATSTGANDAGAIHAGTPTLSDKSGSSAAKPTSAPSSENSHFNTGAAGATPEYTRLLDTIQARSLKELELALKPFLSDLTGYIVDLSSRIRQSSIDKHPHYEAAVILRRGGGNIAQNMLQQVNGYYSNLTPDNTEDQLWQYDIGSVDDLDLIDLTEFEDFLAIDRMVTLGEDLHSKAMEALTVRIATLIDADPNLVRLPVHVRQICRAFQRALMSVNIPHEVHSHIYDYFAKHFVRQLAGYYIPLNKLLASNGIRPDVEKEIETRGSLLARSKAPERPEKAKPKPDTPAVETNVAANIDEDDDPSHDKVEKSNSGPSSQLEQIHKKLGEQLTGALGHIDPANLYRSVVDALNFKREAEGLADGGALVGGASLSGTWSGETVASADLDQTNLADAQSIARVLSALQRDSQAREDVQQSESLREYLSRNKSEIRGLKDSSGLTADSLNQLDMVDNLFDTIKSQLDVSSELKPALGNLQIPMAKMALLDPRFFVDHSHTARKVVDKLSQLATAANFPNKALEGRINSIVDDIISDYESDSSVFDSALQQIEKLATQQERALSRNIERVVRTQEGQERLAEARRAVDNLIGSRLQSPTAPKVLMDLIEGGWRELFVLTHVKEGPDSKEWAEQVKTLDLISLWLDEQLHGEVDDDLSMQRGLEAGPLIDLVEQQISGALPTNVTHEAILEELRAILAGTHAVVAADVTQGFVNREPDPLEIRARIEDLPRLRRWVRRVEQLESGSWLAYRNKQGDKKRMQLAWISPMRDRFIFVNERGQKVADLSAIKLARQLSRGVQPPAPTDRLSAVDQSMYHTLEHVQKTLSFTRNHDSLTKLINRETFLDQMARALHHSQQKQSQHAVLYLNIDQFSLVNDVYDRIIGDQVLLEFAKLLAQLHGKKSSSARMEGDEFALLLLDRSIEQAVEVAEHIRADIEASSMDIEGENVSFTVSIGVAPILEHSPDVEELLNSARSAMEHGKQEGRNTVVPFQPELSAVSDFRQEKKRSRENLETALATDRFVLRAQPIMQTAVGGVGDTSLHYELLLGITNQDGSLSSPVEFIQSAERYGFMTLVDRWVVRETFSWISELMDAQKVVPNLAINLSGNSVTDDSFMEYLLEQISEFGVGTSRLCFEITETGTISNLVKAADFVRAFRNIGCKFSIDDFGTGLASHSYLRELPVDYVKIDGSFITGIHKNRKDYAMARSINDLAHFLGQKTIAESVENDAIVAKLEEIGVDYLQGWGIGKPKTLKDVTTDLPSLEK